MLSIFEIITKRLTEAWKSDEPSGTSLASSEALSEQLMTSLTDELNTATVDMIIRGGLHEYLDRLQTKMNAVGDGLLADFFVWRPVETAEDMTQTQGAGAH